MTYAIMRLVGNNRSIDLLEPPYALQENGWAPAIASRARGVLGGRGLYNDAPEEITIDVFADTAPEALEALAEVSELLDEAGAWARGETDTPVLFECQLEGSALSEPLVSVVLTAEQITMPPGTQDQLIDARIDGATIAFTRRGQWLGAEQEVAAATPVTNPAPITVATLTPITIPSPTIVKLTNFSAATDMLGDGYLLLTGVPPLSRYGYNFAVLDVADMTYGTEWTSTVDTTNDAVGGNVLRIDAAADQTGTITFEDVGAEVKKLTCFIALRNNHATTTWQIRVRSSGLIESYAAWRTIDASSQNPRILNLHDLQNEAVLHQHLHIDVKTTGSVGTLDINYLAILPHDQSTHYVAITGASYSSLGYARNVVFDHRVLTHLSPLAYIETEN